MRELIESLPREALDALVADLAARDPGVRARLEALGAARSGTVDERAVRSQVTRATTPPRDHTWRASRLAAARAQEAVDLLRGLVDAADPAAPRLVEHLVLRIDRLLGRVDDSAGHVGAVHDQARDLHLAACRAVPPPPRDLAARLVHLAVTTEWDWMHDAPERYRDVLGQDGLEALDREVSGARGRQPDAGTDGLDTHVALTLRFMAASSARAAGDVDRLVAVLREDLGSPYRYVKVAEALESAGREREALAWLERGRVRFGTDDGRLRAELLRAHLRDGNGEDALAIADAHMARRPTADAFTELRGVCPPDLWPARREAALSRIAAVSNDELVRALLADGAVTEALDVAESVPLHATTHRALARAAGNVDPARANGHHRIVLNAELEPTGRHGYRRAIAILREMHGAAVAQDRTQEVIDLAMELRRQHHRRPALVQMLDKLGWW